MKSRILFCLILESLLIVRCASAQAQATRSGNGAPARAASTMPRAPQAEERAIRAVLAQFDSSWILHEPRRREPLFADDADMTNVVGATLHGAAARIGFRGDSLYQKMYANAVQTFDSVRIRFLTPTLANVDGYWTMRGAVHLDGTPWENRRGLMNLIMTKRSGAWRIEIFHNAEFPRR